MRKVFLVLTIFLTSCTVERTSHLNPYTEFSKAMHKLPQPTRKSSLHHKQKSYEVVAEVLGAPARDVVEAFCLDQNLVCDTSGVSDKYLISVSYKGSREGFLKLLKEKGISYFKSGNLYVFYTPPVVSIKAVNIPLGELLKILSKQVKGYSIVVGKNVDLSTPVTVIEENKPLSLVLKEAVNSLGYDVVVNSHTKTIQIVGWKSEVIPLPSFFTNFKTANLSASASVYGSDTNGSNTSSSLSMTFLQQIKSSFENTIRKILESNREVGAGYRGKFSVNYDTGELYIEGTPEQVEKVKRYVKSLSDKLSKQVLVDIAVIEQRKDNSQSAGVDWTTTFTGLRNKDITITQSSLGAANGVLSIEVKGSKFNSVIKAIQKSGNARIITNFRLLVPNYDVGMLSSAVTRQFITQIRREVNSQTGREVYTTTTQQVSEGSALFVRPVIRNDGKIDVVIAPTVSSILGVDTQQYENITLKNPIVAQRNSPLRLIVKPDTTYVVGGILNSSTSKNVNGVPLLSSLPLFGEAFGTTTKERKNSVIYIVLRTHVVKE